MLLRLWNGTKEDLDRFVRSVIQSTDQTTKRVPFFFKQADFPPLRRELPPVRTEIKDKKKNGEVCTIETVPS